MVPTAHGLFLRGLGVLAFGFFLGASALGLALEPHLRQLLERPPPPPSHAAPVLGNATSDQADLAPLFPHAAPPGEGTIGAWEVDDVGADAWLVSAGGSCRLTRFEMRPETR